MTRIQNMALAGFVTFAAAARCVLAADPPVIVQPVVVPPPAVVPAVVAPDAVIATPTAVAIDSAISNHELDHQIAHAYLISAAAELDCVIWASDRAHDQAVRTYIKTTTDQYQALVQRLQKEVARHPVAVAVNQTSVVEVEARKPIIRETEHGVPVRVPTDTRVVERTTYVPADLSSELPLIRVQYAAARQNLRLTTMDLGSLDGDAFDDAFLAEQIAANNCLLAAATAGAPSVSEGLRAILHDAEQVAKTCHDQAQQLRFTLPQVSAPPATTR
jgi:hypothetical protein